MILTGSEIIKEVESEKIKITPFLMNNITTNSYDLTLGNKLLCYEEDVLDPKIDNKYSIMEIPSSGFSMKRGDFFLGETTESFGSDYYVPLIHGRSGIARLGLFVHITADLIDIGSYGKSTLQLYATLPITLYPNMHIAQVSFWTVKGDIRLYKGKYLNDIRPTPSKAFLDFDK